MARFLSDEERRQFFLTTRPDSDLAAMLNLCNDPEYVEECKRAGSEAWLITNRYYYTLHEIEAEISRRADVALRTLEALNGDKA